MTQKDAILLIGVSGPSCSGKTTLARLLRDIWPSTFILHEDDFYWPDTQIPIRKGVQDWDCLESLDLDKFRKSLEHIKENGTFPPDLQSKEDQNDVGESGVSMNTVHGWQKKAERLVREHGKLRIALVDGFLLYSPKMEHIGEMFDVRLFLRTNHETVKKRREARSGYVTLEGFWQDPPGYVDNIVWPNYVQDHAFLFVDGDVEGDLDENASKSMRLEIMPSELAADMTGCLEWACHVIQKALRNRLGA